MEEQIAVLERKAQTLKIEGSDETVRAVEKNQRIYLDKENQWL